MSKQYETVIGLEVHVELATKTKIFCGCSTAFGGAPNTHTCPVCTGMPGSLPVLNKQVVEYAMAVGLAANCQINQYCKFDRKNYFYPDNPQNYQISQLYLPICHDGWVEIETESGVKKKIGIHEIHMEEDAGKLVHDEWEDCSLVDYNRSGVPLIEIVSEPDMRSAEEVIAYLEKLRLIIQYLGASDCKLQEGSMRADVNLSVREVGAPEFGTRTEMKNINSFKAIAHAIEGETRRQIELIEDGKKVIQETRRWDDNKESSKAMRSKEDAQDYRYFPDPDLTPVVISDEWIARIKAAQPELRTEKMARWKGIMLDAYAMADLAYEVEREDLKIDGGYQDQYAATFGGFNFIEFHGRNNVVVNPLRIKKDIIHELQYNLLLCYTGKIHVSANIIKDQVQNYEKKDAFDAMCEVKALAYAMKDELLKGNLHSFGKLLDYGWQSKKRMSNKISNPQIDELYAEALKAGALGGKLLGAGGGGYLLMYCPYNVRHKVAARMEAMGGQLADWNFELRGAQSWVADEDRWQYDKVKVQMPNGEYCFNLK